MKFSPSLDYVLGRVTFSYIFSIHKEDERNEAEKYLRKEFKKFAQHRDSYSASIEIETVTTANDCWHPDDGVLAGFVHTNEESLIIKKGNKMVLCFWNFEAKYLVKEIKEFLGME